MSLQRQPRAILAAGRTLGKPSRIRPAGRKEPTDRHLVYVRAWSRFGARPFATGTGESDQSSANSTSGGRGRLMDLVLVRHGQSEGNVARSRSMMGDHSLYVGEFLNRHSSLWRLTNK